MATGPIRPLGKKYSAEILMATAEPCSARELSEELDIPIATSYRRIEELLDAGLLALDGQVRSAGGRRTKLYRGEISAIAVEFDEEAIDVSIERRRSREAEASKVTRNWATHPE
jgi:predicted transcriptional regulator